MDLPNNLLADPEVTEAVLELPSSTCPWSIAIGAKETKKENEKGETILYSLAANAVVPAKSLSETGIALAGFIAKMQAMMRNRAEEAGIPLEDLEEEEDAHEEEEGDGDEKEEGGGQQPAVQTF